MPAYGFFEHLPEIDAAALAIMASAAMAAAKPTQGRNVRRWLPWCASVSHVNWKTTVPSETVGRAAPRLLAFLAIQSRATRTLSSVPVLSW